jgi:hypothetical protein
MQRTRRPPRYDVRAPAVALRVRAWSLLLVLALAAASFMHVAHGHDPDAPSTYQQHCAFCSTGERGTAPPPALGATADVAPAPPRVATAPSTTRSPHDLRASARPRAPPRLQA